MFSPILEKRVSVVGASWAISVDVILDILLGRSAIFHLKEMS
jgi:hypothetical protein